MECVHSKVCQFLGRLRFLQTFAKFASSAKDKYVVELSKIIIICSKILSLHRGGAYTASEKRELCKQCHFCIGPKGRVEICQVGGDHRTWETLLRSVLGIFCRKIVFRTKNVYPGGGPLLCSMDGKKSLTSNIISSITKDIMPENNLEVSY